MTPHDLRNADKATLIEYAEKLQRDLALAEHYREAWADLLGHVKAALQRHQGLPRGSISTMSHAGHCFYAMPISSLKELKHRAEIALKGETP